ncbi:MAG: hypothetical protein HYX40_12105 [Sphingobacteriales bacterium]|nr:hypothetical protein [Sphingobacteriales bacterium]
MVKLDPLKGLLYGFYYNIYWEWSIAEKKLVHLVNKKQEAIAGGYLHEVGNFMLVDETIYYSIWGKFEENDKRLSWSKLMGVSKSTGDIVDQYEFKIKRGEKDTGDFKQMEYSEGKFYLLDGASVLWIIEK